MITAEIEGAERTAAALGAVGKEIPRVARSAINKTATKTRRQMSDAVKQEIAIKPRALNQVLKVRKRARQTDLRAVVALDYQKRLSVKEFGAKHTRKGVGYRISKRGGRSFVPGGFMGPRPGVPAGRLQGHAFKRTGPNRLPIARIDAVSPWAVYNKNRMQMKTVSMGRISLRKELEIAVAKVIAKRKLK